jgi:ABC-2 type transport system permease protein
LLTLPIPTETIFRWKFMESTLLASWAFLFLIAPLLAAYGLTQGVKWHFYFVTVGLVAMFIVLPAVIGAWCAVNLARYLDRRSFQVLMVVVAGFMLLAATSWLRAEQVTDEMLETRVLSVLDKLLDKTKFSQFPMLPSYWLSSGVLQWAEGAYGSAGFFALVLLSYTLFFGFLAFTRLGNPFYAAASAVSSRGSVLGRWEWFRKMQSRRREFGYGQGAVEAFFSLFAWVPRDVRALLIKDVRMFWRDTTQWGQTLMLFGLLGAYIINLRHFSHQLTSPFWIHLVSYLNLGACALNLATLTTRFVYPQFSLEGKRVWIVGLAPLGLVRVVRAKYWLANSASLVVTLSLMTLSCLMLKMPPERTFYFVFAVGVMTFTLNGLAVGLGTLYPNFKEDNPSKIVSGFGGTFCLVLSFLYIVASVVLLAVGSPWGGRSGNASFARVATCWTMFGILSMALGWLPLRLGLRKVAKFEL